MSEQIEIKVESMEYYPHILTHVMDSGHAYSPKGDACVEVRPAVVTFEDPLKTLYRGCSRKINYRFFAIEALGYIAGLHEKWYMDLLCSVNRQFEKYRNAEGGLLGAYGPQMIQSLFDIVDLLSRDASSRQCIMSIWSPGLADKMHANTPCTCLLHFYIENINGVMKLSCNTYMRSNDLNWGFPYDIPSFCAIQSLVAGALNLPIGKYTHIAGSLHYYQNNPPRIGFNEVMLPETFSVSSLPLPMYRGTQEPVDYIKLRSAEAKSFLLECMAHSTSGARWYNFETALEKRLDDRSRYWLFWADCIRFRWQNVLDTKLDWEAKEQIKQFEPITVFETESEEQ